MRGILGKHCWLNIRVDPWLSLHRVSEILVVRHYWHWHWKRNWNTDESDVDEERIQPYQSEIFACDRGNETRNEPMIKSNRVRNPCLFYALFHWHKSVVRREVLRRVQPATPPPIEPFESRTKNFKSIDRIIPLDVLTNRLPPETISNDRCYHHQQSRRVRQHCYRYANGSIVEQCSFETCHVVDAMTIDSELVWGSQVWQYLD